MAISTSLNNAIFFSISTQYRAGFHLITAGSPEVSGFIAVHSLVGKIGEIIPETAP
jgi:hypothetical protein